jgi:hypothetical protein
MDLLYLLGGIAIVAIAACTWTNWRERRREYRSYVAHPTPPGARPAADYRRFVRVWRQHHRSYLAYCENTMAAAGKRLPLGAYLRHCELMAAAGDDSPSGAARPKVDSGARAAGGA